MDHLTYRLATDHAVELRREAARWAMARSAAGPRPTLRARAGALVAHLPALRPATPACATC